MTDKVNFKPDGYHSVTPYLIINGASKAIEFYKKALNAKVNFIMDMPDGRVGHAEIGIGDSNIMIADACEESLAKSPLDLSGTAVMLHLYVEDVDALFNQAIEAGATSIRPIEDQFYGDRSGGLRDPFGHIWYLATHIKDVSTEELEKGVAAKAAEHE